jgi:adenosyl cobinamide kinase/adenosyl cobinamide phosphate guanylyltransferase
MLALMASLGCHHNLVIVTIETGKIIPESISAREYCKAMAKARKDATKFCDAVLAGGRRD